MFALPPRASADLRCGDGETPELKWIFFIRGDSYVNLTDNGSSMGNNLRMHEVREDATDMPIMRIAPSDQVVAASLHLEVGCSSGEKWGSGQTQTTPSAWPDKMYLPLGETAKLHGNS